MADGTFPSLVSKDRDLNAPANPIYVQLTDGAAVLTTTGTSLDVNITGGTVTTTLQSEFQVDDAAGATDFGLNVLVVRDDALTTLTPADGDYVSLRVDSEGRLWVTANNSQYNVDDVAGATDTGTLALFVRDDALTTLTPADGDYVQGRVDSLGRLWVHQVALNLTDDAVKVSKDANPNSILNPIYVQNVSTTTLGDEIHNYSTATPAGDAASNHDYTVAGTTFLLKSIIVSCSGAMKAEIQTGPVASLVTKAVVFLNARQGDTKQVFFDPPIEVPVTSTGTVRVIRTNRNSSATDVYSTIIGNDVA